MHVCVTCACVCETCACVCVSVCVYVCAYACVVAYISGLTGCCALLHDVDSRCVVQHTATVNITPETQSHKTHEQSGVTSCMSTACEHCLSERHHDTHLLSFISVLLPIEHKETQQHIIFFRLD